MDDDEPAKGSAFTVLKASHFTLPDKIVIPQQRDLNTQTANTGKLSIASSTITKSKAINGLTYYHVDQFSPTIDESVKVLLNGPQIVEGYQRRAIFDIIYRVQDSLVFIFTSKFHVVHLLNRFRELPAGQVWVEPLIFNFGNATEIPEITNIRAVWEKEYDVNVKTVGRFGTNVNKSNKVHLPEATAISFLLEDEGSVYALAMSCEGRIGSRNIIKKEKEVKLFDKYLKHMVQASTHSSKNKS
ncbi:MAG: hypothetical protein JXB14_01225 [Candidatus Altiarchaeota archaeon]|nr:hypothetical protein [Candidatus Altiarchaeota archaeon]